MRLVAAPWALLAFFCAGIVLASPAGADEDAYPPVLPGHELRFPKDLGAHSDYRTEWWYVTGWLTDEAGTERGFQVTFFRVRTLIGEDNPSRFSPDQLILGHAAVTDVEAGRLRHAERAQRATAPLAGAQTGNTHAWIHDWTLQWRDDHYHTRIDADDFAFELRFTPEGAPVLNGRQGFSQKAPDPLNASYYYSRPQMATQGRLWLDDNEHAVTGHAWLDHEWSSEILPEGAQGWDWMGINMHDGGSLMVFQMRDEAGDAMWAAGTLHEPKGGTRTLEPEAVRFTAQRHWRSPRTGVEYPVEWGVVVDERRFRIEPLIDDQELDSTGSTGATYWEGAVRVFEADEEVGQGYLEMTGYRERLQM